MSLRVSTKSVYQWRRAWRVGGGAALASKGEAGAARKEVGDRKGTCLQKQETAIPGDGKEGHP
jgi:transposase-like protein